MTISSVSLLSQQSVMEWKHKGSLPVQMNSLHIVRIGNNVYCGGGFTCKVSTDRLVLKYDCEEDKWSQLPICSTLHFGLTQLDEKLVTVGGRDSDALTPIKDMYIFEEDSQTCHVLIGSTFLLVCLYRLINHQFTRHHHFGFEAAA